MKSDSDLVFFWTSDLLHYAIFVSDIDGIIDLDHDSKSHDSYHDNIDAIDTSQYYFRSSKEHKYVPLYRNPHVDLNAPLCYIENEELVCEHGKHKVRKTMLRLWDSYRMIYLSMRGDNSQALVVVNHGKTILIHLHQCKPCILRDILC